MGEDSDVYVIKHVGGHLVCYDANLAFECETEADMICHLTDHRNAGDKVPQRAFARLEAERDGRPWKTDVQHALEELNLDQIGYEIPGQLLVDRPTEDV